jgi:RimJ/RimL family protein N-acetyltransferase
MFQRWATDPAVTRYLVWRPHSDVSECVAHIDRCGKAWEASTEFVWFIELRASADLIGSIASRPGGHGVNLGYLLARDSWGEGYMAEALQPVVDWWLTRPDVFRVWATCDVENASSARVLEKAGFEREGVLRRWERHPNVGPEPRDALCFSRTRR